MKTKPTIHLASDHAGFLHKNMALKWLVKNNYDVIDHGAHKLDPEDDYPDYVVEAVKKVSKHPNDRAIIFGGSGQGEAMVANRLPNIRATVYYGEESRIIFLSREHNNANVLSLGCRFISIEQVDTIIETWLRAEFSGDKRHERRHQKIEKYTYGPIYGELLGWAGVLLILSAFVGAIIDIWPSYSYEYLMMNALGAICLSVDAYFDRNIQPIVIYSVWFLLALIGLFIT